MLKLLCKITLLVADHEQIYSRRPIILDTDMLGENVRIIGQSEKRNKEKEKNAKSTNRAANSFTRFCLVLFSIKIKLA